jgi:hypothetical protein
VWTGADWLPKLWWDFFQGAPKNFLLLKQNIKKNKNKKTSMVYLTTNLKHGLSFVGCSEPGADWLPKFWWDFFQVAPKKKLLPKQNC